MKSAFRLCVLFLIAGILFSTSLMAQEKFGSLNGVVNDETGAVLPGVTVTITNKTTNRSNMVMTAPDGTYFARNLEPGRYNVNFELSGFAPTEFADINILVGQTYRLSPKMKVGGISAKVEVTDVVPMIDTQSTLVAHNITADQFNMLPKSRTFQYFAITSPAVNSGDIEGGIQVNGASGAENAFNIDGVTTNSLVDGRSRQNAAFEYLQEVQVKTAGIDAEYGGALGGVITAVTKSGGNEFHGVGTFYWAGDKVNSSPVKRLVLDARDNKTVGYFQDEKSPFNTYEPGFQISGPVKKDKLYFLSSVTPRYVRQNQIYRFTTGTDAGNIEREQTFMNWFNKVSFDATSRIRGNFTWLWSPTTSKGSLPGYDGAGPNWLSSSRASNATNLVRGFFQPQSNYSGNIDIVASSNLLVSVKGGFFWDNYKDTGVSGLTSVTYAVPNNLASTGPLQAPANTQNTPRVRLRLHDQTSQAYGQADASLTGNFGGFHNIKFGYGLRKNVNNVQDGYPGGAYVLLYWDNTFTFGGRSDRGTYGYYEVNEVGTLGSSGAGIKSVYFQDQWRVNDRLTLNLGVRTEQERIPSFRRDIKDFAFDFGWKQKLAPRLGGSYDLRGDGRVKVYGGWGRFYDWTKYDLARGTFGGDVWRIYYRSLDTLDVYSLSLDNKPGRNLWNSTPGSFRDRRVPAFGAASVDPEIQPMSQDQISGGVDYQWNSLTVFGARYVHNNLRRTIEDMGVLVNGDEVYIYANPGEGMAKTLTGTTGLTKPFAYPKPKRQYDAIELTVNRRMSNGWFGDASYTYSRLYGNYAGLANSDEIRTPTTNTSSATSQQQGGSVARPGGNANRAWDLDEILWDSKGHLDPQGRLATDRPHVFKLNGGYELPNGTTISAFFYLGSGTPLTTQVNTTNQVPVFVNGRGDLGRTPWLNYTDLLVGHNFKIKDTQTLRFEFNMLNAFNQKTVRHRFTDVNRGAGLPDAGAAIDLSRTDLAKGYDYNALVRATSKGADAFDPRFGKEDLFSPGFGGRFGVKWSF